MSLHVGRIQCRKHPSFVGVHLPKVECMACDLLYFMRKNKRYFFYDVETGDDSCIEVRKLVLRRKK